MNAEDVERDLLYNTDKDPMFQKIIESSIDDPRYYVVTDSMDEEV